MIHSLNPPSDYNFSLIDFFYELIIMSNENELSESCFKSKFAQYRIHQIEKQHH